MSGGKDHQESAAFLCEHVYKGERPILLVYHEDGEFQFLCGEDHGEEDLPRVVGLNHMVGIDPSVSEALDMPNDHAAYRKTKFDPWQYTWIAGGSEEE